MYIPYVEYLRKNGYFVVPFDDFHSVRYGNVHLFSIPPGKIYEKRHDFHFWETKSKKMIHRSYKEYIDIANGWLKRRNDYIKEWNYLDNTKDYYENSSSFYE